MSARGWFKPYVAGFYAMKYLGQNLTRAQVMARLDELLALVQDCDGANGKDEPRGGDKPSI